MQSKLDALSTRVNEVEERVSDIENTLMARKEAEEKRKKQLKSHEERLREIKQPQKENQCLIEDPKGAEGDRGPESIFEQIIAENFPNLGRETLIEIQEIERSPLKSIKTVQHLHI